MTPILPVIAARSRSHLAKKHPLGYDECRRHVKAWLLAGVEIDPTLPSARTDHVRINPRTDLYVPEDEAELDAKLASLNLDPE